MITAPIDRESLRARYRAERDKRLRPDGNDQYLEPTGRFAHFLDDPYVERVEREPVIDEVTVAVIGGGFAGLVTGARLKQAGVDDVRIVEGGGDVGGAWYWNRYPGAMCDTAAMIYLPLLEETGHMPTQKYTLAPEIFGHARNIATQFGLYDNALFSTEVTALEWDDAVVAVDRPHRSGRRVPRPVRVDGNRSVAPAQAAGHPGHRDVRRPLLPHEPVGLRVHGRRLRRRADGEARRQAGRHHRHRRDRGAVHPAARARRRRALRVPADTVVDRRAQQPPDRPRVVRARSRRAGSASGC